MAERKRLIAPSILSADFANIAHGVRLAEMAGSDWIHFDVMDGNFVPPITFGSQMAEAVRKITTLPLDAHLMVVNPATHVDSFAAAGIDRLTFHIEAEVHAHRLAVTIREKGMKAGISIVPSTPVSAIQEVLDVVDQVLVMTVNPGYGGQKLIPSCLRKVEELVNLREKGAGDYLIEIDGGFGKGTAGLVWDSGTDVAVMGSAFYGDDDPQAAMEQCRNP